MVPFEGMSVVRAAGGLLWRDGPSGPQLAVVHRPQEVDWSLPKGKLDDGEPWEAAVRDEEGERGARAGPRLAAGAAIGLVLAAALALGVAIAFPATRTAIVAGGAAGLVGGGSVALAALAAGRLRRPVR